MIQEAAGLGGTEALSSRPDQVQAQKGTNHDGSVVRSATRLLRHMSRIFQDQAPPPVSGVSFVDSMLRRKIREKKIAMGHKADDHEEQVRQPELR